MCMQFIQTETHQDRVVQRPGTRLRHTVKSPAGSEADMVRVLNRRMDIGHTRMVPSTAAHPLVVDEATFRLLTAPPTTLIRTFMATEPITARLRTCRLFRTSLKSTLC
jgi:hypothetical protein